MTFGEEKAQRAVNFIKGLNHVKDPWHGRPFELLPWEDEIVRDAYGTLKKDGTRQYRTVYIEIPKKSGKTELMAAMGLKQLCADDEWAAEVYGCASDRGQASLAFDVAIDMVDQNSELRKMTKPILSKHRLVYLPTKSFYQVCSSEAFCMHPDTLIEKKSGEKIKAKDAKQGDEILGWNGKNLEFGCINSSEEQQESPAYRIVTHRGREITVTAKHKFLVMETGKRFFDLKHKYNWTNAKDLKINNRIRISLGWPENGLQVETEEAWVSGAWAGDGECGRFRFINTDDSIVQKLRKFIESIGGTLESSTSTRQKQNPKLKRYPHEHSIKGVGKRRKSPGREWIKHHFGQDARSGTKDVPEFILKGNKQAWSAFLAGYLDTDGCVPNHSRLIKFSSSSKKMLATCQMLFARLEINACLNKTDLTISGLQQLKKAYELLSPYMAHEGKKKALKDKLSKIEINKFSAHDSDRIVEIELLKPIKTISLEVENIDTHVTNGIVTHNTKHGLNVSACLFDELHAQPNRDLYDVMTFGSGDARRQPLYIFITTAGRDPERTSIGWEVHEKAENILLGKRNDPTFYPVIYGYDPDNKRIWTGRGSEKHKGKEKEAWKDKKIWKLVNPSDGIAIREGAIQESYDSSKGNEADELNFQQFRLNIWVKVKTTKWLPLEVWNKNAGIIVPERLKGRECYGGLDLSGKLDLTAFVLLFPPNDEKSKWDILPRFWIPEDNMWERVKKDHIPYDKWAKAGFIKTTPGNVVDYQFIRKEINLLRDSFDIQEIGYDPWNAMQTAIELEDDGFTMAEVRQGYKSMSPPMKEIEALLVGGKMNHGNHPVLNWNFNNLEVKQDENDNVRPVKSRDRTKKIDGIVALINAKNRAMEQQNNRSAYDTTGSIFL